MKHGRLMTGCTVAAVREDRGIVLKDVADVAAMAASFEVNHDE